jgi:hypothetical protein
MGLPGCGLRGWYLPRAAYDRSTARIPNGDSEPERRATISLALLIVKLLAGKMHEGWDKLRNGINDLVGASLSAEGRDIRGQLANCLARGSHSRAPV